MGGKSFVVAVYLTVAEAYLYPKSDAEQVLIVSCAPLDERRIS